MRKFGLFHPISLLACWTGLVLAGTFVLVETTVQQSLALDYPSTTARIVRSEVGHGAISRRGVEVEYNYEVDGIGYTGYRYRYDDHNIALEWEATVDDLPRWSSQKVFYNPKDPADCLLEPGVDGGDLLLLLFALPTCIVTGTLWFASIGWLREASRNRPAGGVRIFKQPGKTRISLAEISSFTAGFFGLAGAAFVAAFPVVAFAGFDPSISLMKMVWTVVLATGGAVFVWRLLRNNSGIYDLRIDEASQTVILPRTAERPRPIAIPRKEICAVSMQRRVNKSPSGTHFSFLPALKRLGAQKESQVIKLVTLGWTLEKAQAFGQWLSQELEVEFKGIEEEQPGLPVEG